MTSPCGGCPPHCAACTFDKIGVPLRASTIIVPAAEYGCVKGFGGIVRQGGVLGQERGGSFHPVTPAGASFLRKSGNALAAHL